MKYFKIEENPIAYQYFKHEQYKIPLQDIMLVKQHRTESVTYALYSEEEHFYLLTNISVKNNYVWGYGTYAKPYCKLEEIDHYALAVIDQDAYNWYMTQAR